MDKPSGKITYNIWSCKTCYKNTTLGFLDYGKIDKTYTCT